VHGQRLTDRPTRDLSVRELLHEREQALHALAVECGQHELPLLEVGVLVQQDHRVTADDGLE
jgi:hypothetical protein